MELLEYLVNQQITEKELILELLRHQLEFADETFNNATVDETYEAWRNQHCLEIAIKSLEQYDWEKE